MAAAPQLAGIALCPALESGDHMDAAEFHRRYEQRHDLKKAELIDGVVYVPSPARSAQSNARFRLIGELGMYARSAAGVIGATRATLRAGPRNEPQPDVMLCWDAEHGGRSRVDADSYLTGAPELVAEVAASSLAYDLYEKKELYRRLGVQEHLVWQVEDRRIDWWELRDGEYVRLAADADGRVHSSVFPGLALDVPSLVGSQPAPAKKQRQRRAKA